MKGSLQRGPACRGPSQTQGWLLGQIPGGWGQRPHCSPDPQTPPNALGIRSLSFHSSVPYRPRLFATGSSPGPSSRRVWGVGGQGATSSPPPPYTQPLWAARMWRQPRADFRASGPGTAPPLSRQALPGLQWPPRFSHPSEPCPSFQASSRQPLRTPSPQRSLLAQTTTANLSLRSPVPNSGNQVSPAPLISYHTVLIPKQGP